MRLASEMRTQLCTLPGHEIRNNMDTNGRRLLSYLRPGFLIEYETNQQRHLALVLEIHWLTRYGLSEISVLSSCSYHKVVHVKDVTAVIAFDGTGVLYL